MKNHQNIDRLFQEKLKDFEVAPNSVVWDKINTELRKEENKKVIPMWLKLSGIAALLILFIAIGNTVFSGDEINTNMVNNDQETNQESSNDNSNNQNENIPVIINDDNEMVDNQADNNKESENILNAKNDSGNPEDATTLKKKNTITSGSGVADNHLSPKPNTEKNNNAVANTNASQEKSNARIPNQDLDQNNIQNKGNAIVTNGSQEQLKGNNSKYKDGLLFNNKTTNKDANAVANVNQDDTKKLNDKNAIRNEKKNTFNNVKSSNNPLIKNNATDGVADTNQKTESDGNPYINKDKINAAFENNETEALSNNKDGDSLGNNTEMALAKAQKDSTLLKNENEIEKAVAEQEKKDNEDEDDENEGIARRWDVAPVITPLYYNSFGGGSPIDQQFDSNDKSGSLNMGYGVHVAYQVTDKLSVRSGINKIDVGYKTNDIVVQPAIPSVSSPAPLRSVKISNQASNIAVFGQQAFNVNSAIPDDFSDRFDSFLEQRFGYIEVPVEAKYQISDKRMGIHVIGGMSTLFLNENTIHARQPNGNNILLGEANNLNSVSFTTNIGLGFNYKMSDKFNFNVEPVLKYQINGFSENSGGFQPYFFGIYSGFSFKF